MWVEMGDRLLSDGGRSMEDGCVCFFFFVCWSCSIWQEHLLLPRFIAPCAKFSCSYHVFRNNNLLRLRRHILTLRLSLSLGPNTRPSLPNRFQQTQKGE